MVFFLFKKLLSNKIQKLSLYKKVMTSIKHWLKAFRLRTLPLSLSCIFMGNALAMSKGYFSIVIFGLALLTTILLQILSNLANDFGDAIKGTDNENRVGPTRAIQSGKITKTQMKRAIIINAILAFISGLLLISYSFNSNSLIYILIFVILGIGAIAAAIKYTMGKNPYGYSGLGDLFVFLFFGIIGVIGTYFLQTKQINLNLIFPASVIGLLSAAVLNMNNMRDIENDRASHKNTLVVIIGFNKAKYYHTLLIILSFVFLVITIYIFQLPQLSYIAMIPYVVLIKNIITAWKTTDNKSLDPELKKIALSTFLISIILYLTVLYSI